MDALFSKNRSPSGFLASSSPADSIKRFLCEANNRWIRSNIAKANTLIRHFKKNAEENPDGFLDPSAPPSPVCITT
jgi:hypothetical protein